MSILRTPAELDALYAPPSDRAVAKTCSALTPKHRRFLERSPFYAMATSGPGGLDCSPRGDPPGSVLVLDDRRIALPDRPGNRRLDGLRNLLVDPRIGLLFFIPGLGETLRVNGRAELHDDPELAARFQERGHLPRVVVVVHVQEVFHHCSKSIMRSRIWDPETHAPDFPRISGTDPESYRPVLYKELPKPE